MSNLETDGEPKLMHALEGLQKKEIVEWLDILSETTPQQLFLHRDVFEKLSSCVLLSFLRPKFESWRRVLNKEFIKYNVDISKYPKLNNFAGVSWKVRDEIIEELKNE